MKILSFNHILVIAGGVISPGSPAMLAFAQDVEQVLKLQRVIDPQQR